MSCSARPGPRLHSRWQTVSAVPVAPQQSCRKTTTRIYFPRRQVWLIGAKASWILCVKRARSALVFAWHWSGVESDPCRRHGHFQCHNGLSCGQISAVVAGYLYRVIDDHRPRKVLVVFNLLRLARVWAYRRSKYNSWCVIVSAGLVCVPFSVPSCSMGSAHQAKSFLLEGQVASGLHACQLAWHSVAPCSFPHVVIAGAGQAQQAGASSSPSWCVLWHMSIPVSVKVRASARALRDQG